MKDGNMEIRTKINIVDKNGNPFMGPGLLRLLQQIKKHKSINKAAKDMRLSYVKALNILNRLETCLGRQILIRKRGGSDRGGTEITPFGEKYMIEYGRLEKKVRKRADKEYLIFQKSVDDGK